LTLDIGLVERAFRLFMGLEGQETEIPAQYELLLRGAAAELLRRLKPGVDIAAEMERLCDAAAAVASHGCRALGPVNAGSIRVGDITVGSDAGGGLAGAKALRDETMARIADLLKAPDDFAFITAEVKL
jgi:hypothetical protein